MITRQLGMTDYQKTWQAMQIFTQARTPQTPDELWLTEHPAVYTLGLNRKESKSPLRNDIPLVLTDRGGNITYHGPGQVVIYLLIDLKRNKLKVRPLVSIIEASIIELLATYDVMAEARTDAPGVYVAGKKIASLGLRLKNNCCYHGLSLNVDMDLSPFDAIDPCGHQDLQVTQTKDLGMVLSMDEISTLLMHTIVSKLESHV